MKINWFNSKGKKAEGISFMGNKTLNLVLAALVIVILVIFLIKIMGLLQGKNDLKHAEAELDEILIKFKSISNSSIQREHFLLSIQDWYLFSTEFGDYCNGNFCLCICKDMKCEGTRMCAASEKFVLLRDLNGKEQRLIKLGKPYKFKLFLDESRVYPYNGGSYVSDFNFWTVYFSRIQTTSPLFFKFDNGWKWSPDLKNWQNMGELRIKVGQWSGESLSEDNKLLIQFINEVETAVQNPRETVEAVLKRNRATESKGVYIMQAVND